MKKKIEEESKKEKIGFLQKIKYSITNLQKISEMGLEGLKSAWNYLVGIILILSLVFTGISIYREKQYREKIEDVLKQSTIEYSYKDGELTVQSDSEIITDEFYTALFNGPIVIADEIQEDVNSYIEQLGLNDEKVVILLQKTSYIVAEKNEEGYNQTEHKYSDIANTYYNSKSELSKNEIIEGYLEMDYVKIFIQFFIIYLANHILTFGLNILILSVIGILTALLFNKYIILKVKEQFFSSLKFMEKYSLILSMAIYSFTTSIILYLIYAVLYYMFNIKIPLFETLYIMIATIYLLLSIFKMRLLNEAVNKK